MADISKLSRLVAGVQRQVDLSSNALVVGSLKVGSSSPTELTKALLDSLLAIRDDLASTANGEGASLVSIEDAAAQFTSTNVEGALAESLDAAQAAQEDATQALSDAADAQQDIDDHIADAAGAHAASAISSTPAGNLASTDVQAALNELDSEKIAVSEKGAANGVATLDANGKLPSSQLTIEAFEYKGAWDADQNDPELANAAGNLGDVYHVSVAGTVNFGAGNITFAQNDKVVYNGSVWEKWVTSAFLAPVDSVNGQTGVVVLDSDDIDEGSSNLYWTQTRFDNALAASDTDDLDEGSTNLYHTDARAKTAAVVNSLAGSETDQAPSVSAVNAALAAISSDAMTEEMIAGETLAAVRAIRMAKGAETAGRVYLADNDAETSDDFYVMGLTQAAAADAADPVMVTKAGKMTATAHGFTVGLPLFLGAAGALTQTAPSAADEAVVRVGMVRDANTIEVQIQVMGVN
jgi:hypothetical protein